MISNYFCVLIEIALFYISTLSSNNEIAGLKVIHRY